jgi:bifunctional non-homologous end joining protein LigD
MATAVAPLSPRAKPGATVSMPLTWAQVKKGLEPTAFTVRTAPKLLAKGAAWNDYGEKQPDLKAIARKLAG